MNTALMATVPVFRCGTAWLLHGVRDTVRAAILCSCWFAHEDIKIGDKFRQRVDEAIRIYDKLLLILSEDSMSSAGVEDEVEAALEKERRENRLVLFPVRIDNAIDRSSTAWAASLWKDHDSYSKAFSRLLRDLKAESTS